MEAGKSTAEKNNAKFFNAAESGDKRNSNNNVGDGYNRPAEELMPLNVVSRIMKSALPPHAKVSEEAKMAVQACLSEYIGFITSEANDRCHREMRKTIFAEDILYALSALGFNSYVGPLTLYLNRYRQSEADRNAVRGEPSVRRTVSYPSLEVQQSPPPPPPPPPVHYCIPPLTTQFAPLHGYPTSSSTPIYGYYRVPHAPAGDTVGLFLGPVYAQPCNAFPGGYGGTSPNAVSAQEASLGGGHGPGSSVAGLHASGSGDDSGGGASANHDIHFDDLGGYRGNPRRHRLDWTE